MSKKATIGESPKDRSMDLMDKFIKRQEKREKHKERLPARRKAKDVPIDLWPLKDQLEYYENMTPGQKFDRKYSSYYSWLEQVKELTGYPASSINDMMSAPGAKDRIRDCFDLKMLPKDAYRYLQSENILWV